MPSLLLIALAGFGAQLVDGALGMGYGVTSTSLLLTAGLTPAIASATVNTAQLGTTLVSGASHWRAGNVHPRTVLHLAIPGAFGGAGGALALTALPAGPALLVTALVLTLLGASVLVRFLSGSAQTPGEADARRRALSRRVPRRLLLPLGLIGGISTGMGGGGWGPIVTSTLLTTGRTTPRHAIGSVSTAEFAVTASAAVGFVVGLGLHGVRIGPVLALMAGGMLAAPIAARIAGRLPSRVLGTAVGSMILVLNLPRAVRELGMTVPVGPVLQILLLLLGAAVVAWTARAHRRAAPARRGDDRGDHPEMQASSQVEGRTSRVLTVPMP